MKPKLPNQLRKKQFISLIIFGFLVAASESAFYFYKKSHKEILPEVTFSPENSAGNSIILAEFNPNELDENQWQKLGFSEKQVKTILNYKKVLGGEFKSKEQLKKCYGISAEKFSQISPYILLPETNADAKYGNFDFKKFAKKELKIPGKFNPDLLSAEGWKNMGFSENQANAILKYKSYLGGSFVSKEKFKECFIISEENYQKLAPYLILPEKTPEGFRSYPKNYYTEKVKVQYRPFDPNLLDLEGWKSLGFSEKQAVGILNFKEKFLKGSFRTLDDVQKCYMIQDKFEELKPYIRLNPENIKAVPAPAYTNSQGVRPASTTAQETKTDFSKTDLNQISFKQLREFGFTEKDAAMLLSFRKKLGGFVNKNQVLETFEIDKNLATKLAATAQLNSGNVAKYSLTEAPEEWLKTHPYFKFSADKIIYYRISNPDDRKIWKFLKLKPEYEAKMRLYVK